MHIVQRGIFRIRPPSFKALSPRRDPRLEALLVGRPVDAAVLEVFVDACQTIVGEPVLPSSFSMSP